MALVSTLFVNLSVTPGLVQRLELRLTNVTLKLFNIRMRSHVIVQSCLSVERLEADITFEGFVAGMNH